MLETGDRPTGNAIDCLTGDDAPVPLQKLQELGAALAAAAFAAADHQSVTDTFRLQGWIPGNDSVQISLPQLIGCADGLERRVGDQTFLGLNLPQQFHQGGLLRRCAGIAVIVQCFL